LVSRYAFLSSIRVSRLAWLMVLSDAEGLQQIAKPPTHA
jgi:hypothetical protein